MLNIEPKIPAVTHWILIKQPVQKTFIQIYLFISIASCSEETVCLKLKSIIFY